MSGTSIAIGRLLRRSGASAACSGALTGTTPTNSGASAVTLSNAAIAGRPPNGTNGDDPYLAFGDTNAVTQAAGQSLTAQRSRTFSVAP